MKTTLTLLTALLLAPLAALHAADTPKPATKPNVVFILADDLGYGDISFEPPPTPGLRREGSRRDEKGNSCSS